MKAPQTVMTQTRKAHLTIQLQDNFNSDNHPLFYQEKESQDKAQDNQVKKAPCRQTPTRSQ